MTRVIVTHFHPDHIGLAGWLCARFGVKLWMTRTEYLMASLMYADARDAPPPEVIGGWRLAGWSEERIAASAELGWGRARAIMSQPPASFRRLIDGEEIVIGDRSWTVAIGCGHTPEHACLVDTGGGVMIAGDQILPRITSNVSVGSIEPLGDPLGDWLASIDRLLTLPEDLLVLPAHGECFHGLRTRLAALRDGHHAGLDKLHAHLATPRRAVDCFGVLFARAVGEAVYGAATGEAMAHLRRLEEDGRAVREVRDGVGWFRAV